MVERAARGEIMNYKGILDSKQIIKPTKLRFFVFKKKDGISVKVSESRDLSEQEILAYATAFMDYLNAKGITENKNAETGEVWNFNKG